jgi:hypothetical protein
LGLEQGPLSLVRIIKELLERKIATAVWKIENKRPWGPVALTTQKLSLTSPTSGGHKVDIVHLRTECHGDCSFLLVRIRKEVVLALCNALPKQVKVPNVSL